MKYCPITVNVVVFLSHTSTFVDLEVAMFYLPYSLCMWGNLHFQYHMFLSILYKWFVVITIGHYSFY